MSADDAAGACASTTRWWSITGAGRNLGREYALLLASRGAKVVVNDFGVAISDTDGVRRRAGAQSRTRRRRRDPRRGRRRRPRTSTA